MDTKSVMIGVLAATAAVLGYLYYEKSQEPSVKIELPGVKIEGN